MRKLSAFSFSMLASNAYARGAGYCTSDACGESWLFVFFWLGFVVIFFAVYGKEAVSSTPRFMFIVKWFAFSVAAMLIALVAQAEVFDLRNTLGMLLVAITGYRVFWYGISLPLKNLNK